MSIQSMAIGYPIVDAMLLDELAKEDAALTEAAERVAALESALAARQVHHEALTKIVESLTKESGGNIE